MFEIEFYETSSGRSEVFEVIEKLEDKARTSKNDRVRFGKIVEHMRILGQYGTLVGFPVVKPMGEGIWELRPFDDRFFFFLAADNKYVMVHHYQKRGRKTPKNELAVAKAHMKDYKERIEGYAKDMERH